MSTMATDLCRLHEKGGEDTNVRVITDPARIALERMEQERVINNPVENPDKKRKYSLALKKARDFFKPDVGDILTYDPPERKLEYHVVVVQLAQEDFFGDDVITLSDIVRSFDGVRIIGDTEQNITLEFMFEGIYKEA